MTAAVLELRRGEVDRDLAVHNAKSIDRYQPRTDAERLIRSDALRQADDWLDANPEPEDADA